MTRRVSFEIDATTAFHGSDGEDPGAELLRLHEWLVDSAKNAHASYPIDRSVLLRVVSELARLRAERQPFKMVMDAALEQGIAEGKCDAAVLHLAERFGFARLDQHAVRLGDSLLIESTLAKPPRPGLSQPVLARLTAMKGLPYLGEGIPYVRRGTCSIQIEEIQT